MEWIQFLQIVCVPAFGWFFYKLGELRRDLNDFKVEVAKEYATQAHIIRLETKLDDLLKLSWEIRNDQNSRNQKQ